MEIIETASYQDSQLYFFGVEHYNRFYLHSGTEGNVSHEKDGGF